MISNRRQFCGALIPAAGVLWTAFAAAQDPMQQTPPRPMSPEQRPPGTEPENPANVNPKRMLEENQHKIQDDVERLYSLAGELREQVKKTDSSNVLSLPLVQKAEEIEKLAKQIRTLARG
ncbi:MAG: hypothetical protein WBL70_16120 [Candidatus Acidiferrales bacterium]